MIMTAGESEMTTPEMSEKNKIIEELIKIMTNEPLLVGKDSFGYEEVDSDSIRECAGTICDFILADRARIVEPLVEFNNAIAGDTYEEEYRLAQKAIGASLRRAGRKEQK
jgi:hypothetical protein